MTNFRTTVGFTVLSHGSVDQINRLISTLDREYEQPLIACHHDFGQSPFDTSEFGENVRFVQPHIPTRWGRFSVVQAQLAALKLLYSEVVVPQWFMHLSASDYPVMPGSKVGELLGKASCDAFVDARPIDPAAKPKATIMGDLNPKLGHFESPGNKVLKRQFYTGREIWLPVLRGDPKWRIGRHTIRFGAIKGVYEDMPAFHGDHWFVGNAKTAAVLLRPSERHLGLQRHLSHRTLPEETYFQTVLMNESSLTICRDNKRFAEWNGGGAHPMFLGEAQLDEMLASGAYFARKFQPGAPVLDKIDAVLASASVRAGFGSLSSVAMFYGSAGEHTDGGR